MRIEFEEEVYRWEREEAWYFVALPVDLSALISELPRPPRGFGSLRVEATIGKTTWRTSIFPDADRRTYVLPLKRLVRDAEGLSDGDLAAVSLDVLDV
jgi:hypothetical protein